MPTPGGVGTERWVLEDERLGDALGEVAAEGGGVAGEGEVGGATDAGSGLRLRNQRKRCTANTPFNCVGGGWAACGGVHLRSWAARCWCGHGFRSRLNGRERAE